LPRRSRVGAGRWKGPKVCRPQPAGSTAKDSS
jgi:hypothetical protein